MSSIQSTDGYVRDASPEACEKPGKNEGECAAQEGKESSGHPTTDSHCASGHPFSSLPGSA